MEQPTRSLGVPHPETPPLVVDQGLQGQPLRHNKQSRIISIQRSVLTIQDVKLGIAPVRRVEYASLIISLLSYSLIPHHRREPLMGMIDRTNGNLLGRVGRREGVINKKKGKSRN